MNPRLVVICHSCQDAWEPDVTEPADLAGNETGCRRCGGWTWLGEIAEHGTAATHTRAKKCAS